mmetsp:Transcript_22274/g.34032  ORF Transcript_22274/g.34032 Transcript_22274/m.34032 type:complete len:94 (-) Transcript_22274:218-499(-)
MLNNVFQYKKNEWGNTSSGRAALCSRLMHCILRVNECFTDERETLFLFSIGYFLTLLNYCQDAMERDKYVNTHACFGPHDAHLRSLLVDDTSV